jgi:uncharacterized protein YjbI with pentapeptide repeats
MWALLAAIRKILAGFIRWAEASSIRKFSAAIGRFSVFVSVFFAAVTYVVDTPKRHQAMIDDALTSIRAVKEQPYSDARQRALMLLNVNCVSATGLNLEHAKLAKIDLRPCTTIDLQLLGKWPPTLYSRRSFDLSHAQMSNVDLQAARLDEANLMDADLRGADLRGAHLRGARLDGAKLDGAKLQGADLREAQLRGARLTQGQLDRADLTSADLSRAILTKASLVRSNLAYADLSHADLDDHANVAGASLCSAQLYKTNLSDATVTHTSFNGTMLLGVTPKADADRAQEAANGLTPPFRLALLVTSKEDVFFKDVEASVKEFWKELASLSDDPCAPRSPRPDVQVTVSATYDKFDIEEREVTKLIEDGVDAILLPQVDDERFPNLIKRAYQAGIVVVCYDSCGGGAELDQYFSGSFKSDQAALGRRAGEYLVDLVKSTGRDEALRLGILHCGTSFENCNERSRGFLSALTSAGIRWQLSGFLEGWTDTNAPAAAAKLLADDPKIDVLWAANGPGTEALAHAAANVSRQIYILGTDTTPELRRLLNQSARNPLRALVGQSPWIMGECGAAAALAALGRKGLDVISKRCLQPMPLEFYR